MIKQQAAQIIDIFKHHWERKLIVVVALLVIYNFLILGFMNVDLGKLMGYYGNILVL